MKNKLQALFRSIFHLGMGETVGRLCNIATVVWLGHKYGVVILGVYALAQSVTQYLQPLIDFGLRHVGARLVALYPHAVGDIIVRVQRRRFLMAGLALALVVVYAASAQLPGQMKLFLLAFSAVGTLYACSLEWAAWGQNRLRVVGLAKAIVPVSILGFLLIGRPTHGQVLWYAVAGNGFGFALQGAFFWWWKQHTCAPAGQTPADLDESLAWRRTRVMGLAWLCYLAFNNIDVLMLGLMSNAEQVGLYGAAYRILNQVLATYYLLTQVLYPQFARHEFEQRRQMLRAPILLPLASCGIFIAAMISLARGSILTVVFGRQFLAAAPLLLLLAWSIPLDFMTSYLSNAFLAWEMERKVLACTGIAAITNIGLNLALIPRLGARGAAINTLVSYAMLLAGLYWVGFKAKEIGVRVTRKAGSRTETPSQAPAGAVVTPEVVGL